MTQAHITQWRFLCKYVRKVELGGGVAVGGSCVTTEENKVHGDPPSLLSSGSASRGCRKMDLPSRYDLKRQPESSIWCGERRNGSTGGKLQASRSELVCMLVQQGRSDSAGCRR